MVYDNINVSPDQYHLTKVIDWLYGNSSGNGPMFAEREITRDR